jgi:hypothetical protein
MTYSIEDMRDAEWDYERDLILAEYEPNDAAEIIAYEAALDRYDQERKGEN